MVTVVGSGDAAGSTVRGGLEGDRGGTIAAATVSRPGMAGHGPVPARQPAIDEAYELIRAMPPPRDR